jgi:uncharacterized membrane protein YeaQ/YmgE (transglycosylase-associated protein family)
MVIIDLMAAIMGVAMGFLAFLVIGGLSGGFAWVFYPGAREAKSKTQKLFMSALMGFLASLASSYVGQFLGLFQSGQMLEWLIATGASCLAGAIYASLGK